RLKFVEDLFESHFGVLRFLQKVDRARAARRPEAKGQPDPFAVRCRKSPATYTGTPKNTRRLLRPLSRRVPSPYGARRESRRKQAERRGTLHEGQKSRSHHPTPFGCAREVSMVERRTDGLQEPLEHLSDPAGVLASLLEH